MENSNNNNNRHQYFGQLRGQTDQRQHQPIVKPILRHPTEGKIQSGRVLKRSSISNQSDNRTGGSNTNPPPIPSRRPTASLMKYKTNLRVNTTHLGEKSTPIISSSMSFIPPPSQQHQQPDLNQHNGSDHSLPFTQSAPTTPVESSKSRAQKIYFDSPSNNGNNGGNNQLYINGSNSSPYLLHSLAEEVELPPVSAPESISSVHVKIYVDETAAAASNTPLSSPSLTAAATSSKKTSITLNDDLINIYPTPKLPTRKTSLAPSTSTNNSEGNGNDGNPESPLTLSSAFVLMTPKVTARDVIQLVYHQLYGCYSNSTPSSEYTLCVAKFLERHIATVDEEEIYNLYTTGKDSDQLIYSPVSSTLSGADSDHNIMSPLTPKSSRRRAGGSGGGGKRRRHKRIVVREMDDLEIPLFVYHNFMFMQSDGYHFILKHSGASSSSSTTASANTTATVTDEPRNGKSDETSRIANIVKEQQLRASSSEKLIKRLQTLAREESKAIMETRERYAKLIKWISESYNHQR